MRSPDEVERRETMLALVRHGWALDNPAFRQMFTSLYIPDATPEQANWYNELQRITTSPKNAEALMRVFATIDVRPLLSQVSVPTLVGHSTRDAAVPFTEGRALAAKIPGARFIAIESPNHLLLESDPGWPKYAHVVRDFLT
jgi:pimeloyl-ACP methyl ester carboxylesterase